MRECAAFSGRIEPELVAGGIHAADEYCIAENAGVAYITTHLDNTIHRVTWIGPILLRRSASWPYAYL
ncbi:MAG: hypothetical protein JWR32_3245 [Mycobacterium sp.]|jgi:hypothetical protein|nr:hypothetical protein [Mycobacterium sp.]